MSVDYILEISCEPRRRLGPDGLLDRLRRLDRLRHEVTLTPEQEARARDLVFELRPLAFHCSRCPANHLGREYGCYAAVHRPLSAEAEDWLFELLPSTLKLPRKTTVERTRQVDALRELLRRVQELGITGEVADACRRDGTLDRAKTLARKYGPLFRRSRLTSSQLLELLLLRERVEPAIAEAACRALGLWEDGGTGGDGVPEAVFTQPEEDSDDLSVAELKRFFLALMVACSLDTAVKTEQGG